MTEILKFGEETPEEPKLGCLMLYFSFSNWSEFVRTLVNQEDIYDDEEHEYGYEDSPHCTILYGFHHENGIMEQIKKYLPALEDVDDIMRAGITLFESENYDVVKFDIVSEKLKNLNKAFLDNFDYTNEHVYYHPHMTIAYVKKGEGAKYVRENVKNVPLFGDKYIYSDNEYHKTEL